MAQINLISSFVSWELSDDELLVGSILTSLHKQCIQNRIAMLAEEKLNLSYTPNDHQAFIQKESELTGKINVLKDLLDISDSAENQLRAAAQNAQ